MQQENVLIQTLYYLKLKTSFTILTGMIFANVCSQQHRSTQFPV